MTQLTEDELTCLGICAQGESLAAIGRWEPSVDALVEKGLLVRHDKFNNTITPTGRAALSEQTSEAEQNYRAAIGKVIEIHNSEWQFNEFAKRAAKELVLNAKAIERSSGQSAYTTINQWMEWLDHMTLDLLARS